MKAEYKDPTEQKRVEKKTQQKSLGPLARQQFLMSGNINYVS